MLAASSALLVATASAAAEVVAPAAPTPTPFEILVMPSLTKVLPDTGALPGAQPPPLRVSLAKREAESIQLIVRCAEPATGVALEPGALRGADGQAPLPAEAIGWSAVGFVTTRTPEYPVEHVGRWPDPLPGPHPITLEAGTPQPFWITVRVGPDAAAGRYVGELRVVADGRAPIPVPIDVTVWDFALPPVPRLQTAFDIYLGRVYLAYESIFPEWGAALARRGVTPARIQEQMAEDLVAHRLAPILNAQPDTAEEAAGLRRFDGLSAFSVGPFGGSFDNHWPADDAEVLPRYRGYAERLDAAGLLERAWVYAYDEPATGLPAVADVTRRLHAADPRLRTLVTLGAPFTAEAHRDWLRDIDIVCVRNVAYDPTQAEALRRMGKTVWLYASGPTPPYPTPVIDFPGLAARILPWMCWKLGAPGFLYWSVNFWTKDPYRDPMNTPWGQHGNGLLFYPGPDGPVPSIRLALLRDGVDDYDYLSLLADEVARVSAAPDPSQDTRDRLAEAQRLLAVDGIVASAGKYTQEPEHLLAARARIAELIQDLRAIR
jgi:hypothetical protein